MASSLVADDGVSLFDASELACCPGTSMRCLWRRVDLPSRMLFRDVDASSLTPRGPTFGCVRRPSA